jgi:hypothetical protein
MIEDKKLLKIHLIHFFTQIFIEELVHGTY